MEYIPWFTSHPYTLYLTFLLEITEDNIEKEKEHYKAVDEIENELKEVDPFYYEKHNEQKTCLTKEDFFLEMSVDLIRCPELLFQPSMVGVEQVHPNYKFLFKNLK